MSQTLSALAASVQPNSQRLRMIRARRTPALRPPWRPPAAPPPANPRRAPAAVAAAAAAAAAADSPDDKAAAAVKEHKKGWAAQLQPLSDPAANRKLLALSTAQMLSSIATLMHDTYLPIYMRDVLGMSSTNMGNLHALLQFLARASGVISGRLADVFSPARMVIVGTLLTALVCKPMFALSGLVRRQLGTALCVSWITYAKILDRTVKGVREAPSKALVGELAHESGDSAAGAFSVRQALSTLGMLLGSAGAALAFRLSGGSYEFTFGLSAAAAALAALLVVAAFGPTARGAPPAKSAAASLDWGMAEETWDEQELSLGEKAQALMGALKPAYWQALATVMLLYVARFDVAFLTMHASTVMDKASLPSLTFFSMAPVILLATPMGLRAKQSVRARNTVLMLGTAVLIVGNLCFAFIPSVLGLVLGFTCMGFHRAMAEGVLFGMLATYIPSYPVPGLGRINGSVWSLTDLLLGVALAVSNTLAGRLTDLTLRRGLGSIGCFLGAAVACAASILAMLAFSTFGQLGKEDPLHSATA